MPTDNNINFNEDAMTSSVVEQNKIKSSQSVQDVMENPNAEEKKKHCPSIGEDIMATHSDKNNFDEDAMTSPAVEQNKIKSSERVQDVMENPNAEEKKKNCPSSGEDIMTIHKNSKE